MLHDFVAGSGLAIFAEVSLVLFLMVFVTIAVRTLAHKPGYYDAIARLPIDDDPVQGADCGASSRKEL